MWFLWFQDLGCDWSDHNEHVRHSLIGCFLFYYLTVMKDTLAVINFRETSSEWIMRCFPEVAVLVLFICFSSTDGWRRRRRRRCAVRNCVVSSWSSWSSCTANQCLQGGSKRRTRWQVTAPLCGGLECPSMEETRQCYGTRSVNCQLSSWSEWSSCSTPCGVSGIQTSSRHRIITEQCGGTCSTTFRKTRSCPEQSCLNGGSLHSNGTCFCHERLFWRLLSEKTARR